MCSPRVTIEASLIQEHPIAASHRAFVLRHTRLGPVTELDEIRLHPADEVLPLWHAVQIETGDPDAEPVSAPSDTVR